MPFIDQLTRHMIEQPQIGAEQAMRLIRAHPTIVIQGILSMNLSATVTALLIANANPSLNVVLKFRI